MQIRLPLALSFVLLCAAAPVAAQNEAALKRALEGHEVVVLMEMPASHRGVDLYVQREPEMEFSEYARRLKQYGVSLRKEDRIMITAVKVNKKNIEVHLGGGGYGTWGDDNGSVYLPGVYKSDREKDLEKERKRTTDASRRREIDRELNYLKRDREREERERSREQQALTAIKQQEIASKRLDGGSRFNIWYADKRLEQWAPTPEELMLTLSRYIAFDDGDAAARMSNGEGSGRGIDVAAAAGGLRRGMSAEDVYEMIGRPTRRRESRQGDLATTVETWETTESLTEVTFVGGVVVKFSTASK